MLKQQNLILDISLTPLMLKGFKRIYLKNMILKTLAYHKKTLF